MTHVDLLAITNQLVYTFIRHHLKGGFVLHHNSGCLFLTSQANPYLAPYVSTLCHLCQLKSLKQSYSKLLEPGKAFVKCKNKTSPHAFFLANDCYSCFLGKSRDSQTRKEAWRSQAGCLAEETWPPGDLGPFSSTWHMPCKKAGLVLLCLSGFSREFRKPFLNANSPKF